MLRIQHPLASLDAYVSCFSSEPIPVLKRTAQQLDALRAQEDAVSGKQLTAVVLSDPLMTLRLLSHMEQNRRRSQNHDITTIDRAIMMIGISPFFRIFADQPTLEARLADVPKALVGALRVIARARRAAHFARDWAILRHDLDVEEITVAALLHDAADVLCWTFAPELTQRVYDMQRLDRGLRSATAQREVFGFTASDLQLAITKAWHLPDLLVSLMDGDNAGNPRVRTVKLANHLARHSARGWDNAAIPDDLAAISDLLRVNRTQLIKHLAIPQEDAERLLPPDGEQ
ncbi:HDOD domain-containing protein [Nitrogeniibacter mangrovi]|uniref:HDOD domain-containing protein n=1 Tax=Nitrogeniibacter mangrovi TaxID=2016596 RepID=A0A6C1B5J0_9RHOO|nr:HDOD domain-containing protein [Nitrogeniibacter mangrovi]QID18737.1 HDOD domain-containing protein [Nitrogeniibacter mangrovi]